MNLQLRPVAVGSLVDFDDGTGHWSQKQTTTSQGFNVYFLVTLPTTDVPGRLKKCMYALYNHSVMGFPPFLGSCTLPVATALASPLQRGM